MPGRLWCMLYCAFDLEFDSGNAQWQTGWGAVCAVDGCEPLRALWQAGASCSLRAAAPGTRDVRGVGGGCPSIFNPFGSSNFAGAGVTGMNSRDDRSERTSCAAALYHSSMHTRCHYSHATIAVTIEKLALSARRAGSEGHMACRRQLDGDCSACLR
jgi:hypothetical protein